MSQVLIILLVLLVIILYYTNQSEHFSKSGLAISDDYCHKLVNTYYKPMMQNPKCQKDYVKRICDSERRSIIDFDTGNFYTVNGELI